MAKPWMNRLMLTGKKRGFEPALPWGEREHNPPVQYKAEPYVVPIEGEAYKRKRKQKQARLLPDLTHQRAGKWVRYKTR